MSMPTKGKHHHLPHHHQQQQPHHNPQQHQLQLVVNVNQPGVPHSSQAYSTVATTNAPRFVPNAGSDFHVPGQTYGAQPGGQVGGGGGSVGVPGGRGPPSLGGIQSIGQSAAGIPPGGPSGGQAPPQASAPGVQSQQPQGPAPTTTPPVHTPSPQEMGKQAHLQTQPTPLPQVYVPTQTRPASQGYFQTGPRPQQPRGLSHRAGQGSSGTQVVGMPGVGGGGGGQPTAMYPHHTSLTVQPGVYVQSQVPGLHTGPHQQSIYHNPINNQMPMQYSGAPQRHQTHQSQSYYQPFQPHPLISPQFAYTHAPPQHGYFVSPHNPPLNFSRASASAVSGGAQHVGGPLAGAQGPTVVPQGTLQQPTQQPQPLPTMGIPLSQTDVYPGHNIGATNTTNSSTRLRKTRGQNAILDIVNPETGKNISAEIYCDNAATQNDETPSNRETPQPQNNSAELIADFAARVAKAATEESDSSGSPVSASAQETTTSQSTAQSLANVQTNSTIDTSSQCNTVPSSSSPAAVVQNIPNVSALCSQSLGTTSYNSNATAAASQPTVESSCSGKREPKPLQLSAKEFQPRTEAKTVVSEEPPTAVAIVNKDNIPAQPSAAATNTNTTVVAPVATPVAAVAVTLVPPTVTELEVKNTNSATPSVTQTPSVPLVTVPSTNVPEVPKPSVTAPSANPVPAREPFPNLSTKTSSSSPPRRKSQTHVHSQSNTAAASVTVNTTNVATTEQQQQQQQPPPPPPPQQQQPQQQQPQQQQQQQQQQQLPPPSSAKEQKERKTREKSLNARGATPTPAHTQPDHHQKTNGDATVDRSEPQVDAVPRNEVQQKPSDGKAMQKQKSKNKLKPRELNRKGAEKEGTDMDAFVNTAPTPKSDVKTQDNKDAAPMVTKDSNKEVIREITKDIKEKDNYESKKEKETQPKTEKHVTAPADLPKESTPPAQVPVIEKLPSNKEVPKESAVPKAEDNLKSQSACIMQNKSVPNDVVDYVVHTPESEVEAIVAQKNEENSKASARAASVEEKVPAAAPVVEKPIESEPQQEQEQEHPSQQQQQQQPPAPTESAPKPSQPQLKYTYSVEQWSPINKSGKKVYNRDFLMQLQSDPQSKIKPANLPDMDAVLKDAKAKAPMDLRQYKDAHMGPAQALFPGFIRPPSFSSTRILSAKAKSHHAGIKKTTKPNVIHVSLSLKEDVKLRETENAWKPTRLKHDSLAEEDVKSEALYKRVRSVLNKLTPQKFNTLVDQVRALTIDTPERLQGVINLVFEKAVDEPSFSVAYALMCKELAAMEVAQGDGGDEDSSISFRTLIINRCQKEFEKNPLHEEARTLKLKEIDECNDPEKKKELQMQLEEEERRIRIKSVGNIRFIGELYKQGMLLTKIMRRCIKHLLDQKDEDSLECLCKLMTTVGKDLEAKLTHDEMQEYMSKMQDLVSRRSQLKISSRIRFMLQDVIDLRASKWIPRRDDSNPKTIDQIQKEAESERLDSQLNNTPLNTPRKDDRNSDRKRNRAGTTDDGWSQPVGRTRQPYSIETAKLKNKPPPMDDMQLGSRNAYMWKNNASMGSQKAMSSSNKFACLENISSQDQEKRISPLQLPGPRSSTGSREYGRDYVKSSYDGRGSRNGSHQLSSASSSRENSMMDSSQREIVSVPPPSMKSVSQTTSASHKPTMTEEQFRKTLNCILKEDIKELSLEGAADVAKDSFDSSFHTMFVRESINHVLESTPADRERVSRLISHMIAHNIIVAQSFKAGFEEVLEVVDDLIIDIPKIWTYFGEIISHIIVDDAIPLSEMKSIFMTLKSMGCSGKLLGEVLLKISRDKGPKWVIDKWDQSGLQLNNIIDPERENLSKILQDYNLEFLVSGYNSAKSSTGSQLSFQEIHDQLKKMLPDSSFDEISSWITANVGDRVKEPKFTRVLTTAVLETSIEPYGGETWKLKAETFNTLQSLIRRYVDANELLELQCLYAIQAYMKEIEFPSGILHTIVQRLFESNTISGDAFMAWQRTPADPAERGGHSIAMLALTSFFTDLHEGDDTSSVEDGSTSVPVINHTCC